MNIQWDSDTYTKNFDFVPKYGEDVLELLDVPPGSFVVDLGCGNGELTEQLCRRGYHVLGIDSSESMIALARRRFPQLDFQLGDALDFQLEHPADAIFSNAVFHWIDREKQGQLAENIASNLRQGGLLVTEFGGKGCAETVHQALEKVFAAHHLTYSRGFYFPTIGEYAPILEKAGFRIEYASLFDRPTPLKTGDDAADWIRMFVQAPFLGMDKNLKEEIIHEAAWETRPVLCRNHDWYIDYVRIRIKARYQYE